MKSRWKAGGSPVLRLAEGADLWECEKVKVGASELAAAGQRGERSHPEAWLDRDPADSAFQLKRVTTLVTEYGWGRES